MNHLAVHGVAYACLNVFSDSLQVQESYTFLSQLLRGAVGTFSFK